MTSIRKGVVVRHRTWKNNPTGTIVRVTADSLFVQWRNTCVETDHFRATFGSECELTDLPNPPDNGLRLGVFRYAH